MNYYASAQKIILLCCQLILSSRMFAQLLKTKMVDANKKNFDSQSNNEYEKNLKKYF